MLPANVPIVVAVDETLERRKGAHIRAKGMYRDAVRSSCSKVVTCLGLEWIRMALLVPVPWSKRPSALPFLTRLATSKRADEAAGRRHRTVVELTIVMVWLVSRWLKQRRWILLGDGSYSCIQLGWEVLAAQASLITRLRLDARLFAFPSRCPPDAVYYPHWTQPSGSSRDRGVEDGEGLNPARQSEGKRPVIPAKAASPKWPRDTGRV